MARRPKKRGSRRNKRAAYGHTFRSGLESTIAEQIVSTLGPALLLYEAVRIKYIKPATKHDYVTDFVLPNGILIEAKGYMDLDGRKKYVAIKNHAPDLDIRFVFSKSTNPIRKDSETTYADWCVNNGFLYADKTIPPEWFTEPPNAKSLAAIFKHKKRAGL